MTRTLKLSDYFALRLLAFACLVSLPLLFAVGFFSREAFHTAKQSAEQRLSAQAQDGAVLVSGILQRAESTLSFLRGRDEITSSNWAACNQLLEGMLHIDPVLHNIWVATPSGEVVCASFNPDNKVVNFSEETWFQSALTGPYFTLGLPGSGKFFPRARVPLLTRVQDSDGKVTAVISVSLNLEAISNQLRPFTKSTTNTLTLVSREGAVFAHSHAHDNAVGTKLAVLTNSIAATPVGELFEDVGPNGNPRVYSVVPIDKYGLYVLSRMDEEEVFALAKAAALKAALAAFFALCLSFVLALVGARTLSQPLKALASTARKQSQGDSSARAPTELPGEFGVVSGEFNRMLECRERSENMLRHSEKQAQRMAEFYSSLAETNQAIGRVNEAKSLYDIVCATCVQSSHAKMAWVGVLEGSQLRPVAWQGPSKEFLTDLTIDLDDGSASSQGPAATAVRSGETVVINDMWVDGMSAYWLESSKRFGVHSQAAVPFSQGGQVVGVLCVYMTEPQYFDEPLVGLLQELALAVSFALESWEGQQLRAAAEAEAKVALLAKDKAEAADSAKSQFLMRMGHELRTPLNAILGFVQILRDRTASKLDVKERSQLDLVFKAGVQLRILLDDALDLTRIETGEVVFSPQAVDVRGIVSDAIALVQPLADEAGVELRSSCVDVDAPELVIDPGRLRQVLINLVSNSIRYNRSGGRVNLSVKATPRGLVLILEDNGMTLSPVQLARIFEPFRPAPEGLQRVSRSGLGMMLTRQMVELLGGRMTIESEEGIGTKIKVLLPKLESLKVAESEQDAAPSVLSSSEGTAGTVLYIEDNHINAVLVQEALEAWPDIRIHIADTGAKGLELIKTLNPDLVLLDMQLPDMSGAELLETLRAKKETEYLRVVVLSASTVPELRARVKAAGALDYWMKPIDFPPMVKGVRRYLSDAQKEKAA